MMCDRIIVDICDQVISQRMQMDSELTLEKVKTLTHKRFTVREQQEILWASTKAISSVDHLHKSSQNGKRRYFQSSRASTVRP